MMQSMETSNCHSSGEMSMDCCSARSAPEPMRTLSVGSARLLTVLVATDYDVVAQLTPAGLPPHSTSADAFRLHGLGRYTLFSSFLL